jgi:hypothetical protein
MPSKHYYLVSLGGMLRAYMGNCVCIYIYMCILVCKCVCDRACTSVCMFVYLCMCVCLFVHVACVYLYM